MTFPTVGPLSATRLAAEAVEAGATTIVSYGGDGTANEVVQAIAGSDVALAVWPGGTANVIARDLGVPFGLERLADLIASGRATRIPLGRAIDSKGAGRYFVMMAGIGVDAEVSRGVSPILKRLGGKFAFGVSAVLRLITWPFAPFTLEIRGRRFVTAFALVAKGKGYGASICLTPDAKLTEPAFQVFFMSREARRLVYLRDFLRCRAFRSPRASGKLMKTDRVKASSESEIYVQVDGEIAGTLPMTFEVVPNALCVLVAETSSNASQKA